MNKKRRGVFVLLMCALMAAPALAVAEARAEAKRGKGPAASAAAAAQKNRARQRPRRRYLCSGRNNHVPTNLVATDPYIGTLTYPGGKMGGPAELKIDAVPGEVAGLTQQTFTLTAGGQTLKGRVLAETSCGETGAALFFNSPGPSAVSVRVCRTRNGLNLKSVTGNQFEFYGTSGSPGNPTPRGDWGVGDDCR